MSGESAEAIESGSPAPVDSPTLAVERWVQVADARDRGFWIALGVAVLLHSTLFLGLLGHQPRVIGDADGSAEGISVSVVTEADLQSKSTVATPPAAPPGQPATAPAQPAPPPAPPPQPQEKAAETPALKPSDFTTETIKAEPENTEPEKAESEKDDTPAETAREMARDVPDILAMPGPGEEPKKKPQPAAKPPAETKTQPKPQPPKPQQPSRTAKLDLTPPPGSFSGSSGGAGRSAGFERPPGITRSGANDDFARNVIRELQKTMPQLRDVLGRVTVRILLNENGNVSDVQVVRTSNNSKLDQYVVFAARQTSYPFPPPNSNLADRTFLVTYIYH